MVAIRIARRVIAFPFEVVFFFVAMFAFCFQELADLIRGSHE